MTGSGDRKEGWFYKGLKDGEHTSTLASVTLYDFFNEKAIFHENSSMMTSRLCGTNPMLRGSRVENQEDD